jgi:hypothetical protein
MFNSITKPSATGCLKVGKKGARLAERLYGLCLQPALEDEAGPAGRPCSHVAVNQGSVMLSGYRQLRPFSQAVSMYPP